MHADDDPLLDAMRAGARGYLLKGAEREETARAVLTVAAGGTAFGGDVGPRIAAYAARPPATAGKLFPELSDREHEVLEYLAKGLGKPRDRRTPLPLREDRPQPRGHDPRCATMPLRSLGRGIAG